MVTRVGVEPAARAVFRTFRNQHLEAFAGARKAWLTDKPDGAAWRNITCLELSRWSTRGVGPNRKQSHGCGTCHHDGFSMVQRCAEFQQSSVGRCRGWHGHNGVSLRNPRLGFVATSQTTDGQPGLVGYYIEEDHDLDPDDRVRFCPGEHPPGPVPICPPSWDPVRLAKVERNYAMNYIHTILPAMTEN